VLLSAVTFLTGGVFWWQARRVPGIGVRVLAWAFTLWSLHHLDYPLLRSQGAGLLYGVFADVALIVLVALGTLVLVLGEGQRALAMRTSELEQLTRLLLRAQEEERRRIARAVHDGPAQAMANVVLQSEISERLFEVDPQRSRTELAALRQMVNKTLQELRGFIFELRPMILDDLGLVPTLRRYVQTLIDKHGVRIDFSSTGRDRRLPSDDEVAIFRLIQDSLVERIERATSKDIVLGMTWKDEQLDILLQADGKDLPPDGELSSGLRRSERLELLHGDSTHETRSDGTVVLNVRVPIRTAPTLIT